MTMLRRIWDGFQSLIAAILAAAVSVVPAYYAYMAIDSGLAPLWVWANIAGLVAVGVIMVLAFLRKAKDGIAPLRERRRA